jgi:cytochrome c-type biogenesis protein CcmE
MGKRPIISAVLSVTVGVAALAGLLTVFVSNASPYMTVKQARTSKESGLHVAGDLVRPSLVNDLQHHELRFDLKDAEGQTMNVVYTGEPLSNIGTATKVVAIGSMRDGKFYSDQMLLKCPSKYESAKPQL